MATADKAPSPVRIVTADDHPTIVRMVREISNDHPHFEVIGEASDGAHAVALVEEPEPT
jgi:DNA-binding NarL/FixJ family response regulator